MEPLHIGLLAILIIFVFLVLVRAIKVALLLMFLIGGGYLLFPDETAELLNIALDWIDSVL